MVLVIQMQKELPSGKVKRRKFFNSLLVRLRTQTGQRDQVYAGITRSLPYWEFLLKQVKSFGLPPELLSISFLESSFNPKAYSKVAAAGVWQIMPLIGNLILPRRTKSIDYRLNPVVSSLGALHLLRENKMILKRWDLAIPAYNSGTRFFVKMKKKLRGNKKHYNLEYILKNFKSSSIGFASRNFYTEFLALAHVLAYKDRIFPIDGLEENIKGFRDPANLKIYISKCSIKPERIFNLLKNKTPLIRDINSHFKHPNNLFKRGTLLVHDGVLSPKKYYELTQKELKKTFPKKYYRNIRNKSCGSKN